MFGPGTTIGEVADVPPSERPAAGPGLGWARRRPLDPIARGDRARGVGGSRGDRRALARLLTAVENRTPVAEAALRQLYPRAGRAHIVGITGPPGAGKSTLVAALIGELRAAAGAVAVIAVDPSSPITGGALLGDRVRMQAYAEDPDVFIRSMAARGHAGGLASTTGAAAAVLDAVGFDLVLVETVGTGQSEVEVAAAADTTVVLEAPEMGDEVQAIKAGLLEVADLVVVNKGDRPGAQRTAAQLRAMLVAPAPGGRPRPMGRRRSVPARSGPRSWSRPPRPAPASRSCSPRSTGGDRPPDDESRRPPASPGPRRRSGRSSATGCGTGSSRERRPGAARARLLAAVAEHRLDPYAAADELLGTATRS